MLLKVDVTGEDPDGEVSQTVYISPSTAKHRTGHVLLQIGRKDSDVRFSDVNEKSVSRKHCCIRLISLSEEGGFGAKFRDEGEESACKDSKDGLIVVLEDLGSKFGTYAILDKKEGKDLDTPEGGNSSETDDATDDESPGSSQQSTPSSKYIERKIPKDENYILHSLSLPLNKDDDAEISNEESVTRIRCGKQYIRISRIRLELCFSRIQPAEKRRILSLLPSIGASITSEFSLSTTHLITPDLISTAKTICAWTCNVPIVTMSFIDALIKRTKGDDPYPHVGQFSAIGASPLNLKILQQPGAAQGMLNGYTCLSLQRTEAEVMLRCGGALIIPLYREQNSKTDWTFWQNKQWWEELEKRREEEDLTIIWLDSTSRKALKGKQYLSKLMQRQENEDDQHNNKFVLKCVNQTCVADALTSLSTLKDIRGGEISKTASKSNAIQNKSVNDSSQTLESSPNLQHSNNQGYLEENVVETVVGDMIGGTVARKGTTDEKESCDDTLRLTTDIVQKQPVPVPAKKHKTLNKNKTGLGWMSTSSQSQSKVGKDKETVSEKEPPLVVPDESLLQEIEERDQREIVHNSMKSLLLSTNDGWLVAAPSGNARTQCRKRMEEIADFDVTYPSDAVSTEICRGLVVRTYHNKESPKVSSEKRLGTHRKKDFKKFKKNVVITSSKVHTISQVRLVSVLPKESEKQIQLRALEKEKEEENQRETDFMEADSRKKTRKRKTDSIAQYFGGERTDAPKRGSARRRVGKR